MLPLLKRFWQDFIAQHQAAFAWAACLIALTVLLQLPGPLLTIFIIDAAVKAHQLSVVDQLVLAYVALVILRHVFSYIHENMTLRIKESVILEVQASLYRRLQSLPIGFFAKKHSTYLQSRMMNDSRAIEGALVRTVVTVATNTLTFIIGAAIILVIHYEMGFVLLFAVIPFALIRYFANQRMRELSNEMQERQATTSAVISERFAGIATIKALGQEETQENFVSKKLAELREIYIKTNWYGIVSSVGASLITSLCTAFVLWYGLHQVVSGRMTIGEVVGILSLLSFIYTPVNNLVATNLSIQRASSALQRIYEFLDERMEEPYGYPLKTVKGKIDVRNIVFGYRPDKTVFNGFSLSIAPGETLALVGHTGAGKSSLARLLLRFYEVQDGQVLIDGHDVRELDLKDLRSAIGVVEQQTFLFTGTIRENIMLGRQEASFDDVVIAAEKAYAHQFIVALPDGYETRVGERGMTLSGGECQRIALARMFLKDPKILILDEAVSAVDSQSEAYIQKSLSALTGDRTTIIIAHRLSSLLLAKRVVLIDDGVLIEDGAQSELLASKGAYAALFHRQFQPQSYQECSPTATEMA